MVSRWYFEKSRKSKKNLEEVLKRLKDVLDVF